MNNPVIKAIVIVLAVIGALAVAGALGMFFLHGTMMRGMSCGKMGPVGAASRQAAVVASAHRESQRYG